MTSNNHKAAQTLLEKWISAINAYDLQGVTNLYATDALFFGTSSQVLLTKAAEIEKYFEQAFTNLRPLTASIGEYTVTEIAESVLAISGFDHWSVTQAGKTVIANGRLSFVIKKVRDEWKIINFHRSAMPD
jgi:uncharacterized protein (TIGR02246 family)